MIFQHALLLFAFVLLLMEPRENLSICRLLQIAVENFLMDLEDFVLVTLNEDADKKGTSVLLVK